MFPLLSFRRARPIIQSTIATQPSPSSMIPSTPCQSIGIQSSVSSFPAHKYPVLPHRVTLTFETIPQSLTSLGLGQTTFPCRFTSFWLILPPSYAFSFRRVSDVRAFDITALPFSPNGFTFRLTFRTKIMSTLISYSSLSEPAFRMVRGLHSYLSCSASFRDPRFCNSSSPMLDPIVPYPRPPWPAGSAGPLLRRRLILCLVHTQCALQRLPRPSFWELPSWISCNLQTGPGNPPLGPFAVGLSLMQH